MIEALRCLAKDDQRFAGFGMGVGVATGDAVVGNLGGSRRFDYSIIGDTVNLAARLESLTRHLKVAFLVNEQTYSEANGHYVARDLGLIRVKGKTHPVDIWEIVGQKSDDFDHSYYEMFSEALALARETSIEKALEHLRGLVELKPEDVALRLYLELLGSADSLGSDGLVLEFSTK